MGHAKLLHKQTKTSLSGRYRSDTPLNMRYKAETGESLKCRKNKPRGRDA